MVESRGSMHKGLHGKNEQRKMQAYVYTIKDKEGDWKKGFEKVAHVMTEHY